MDLPLGRWQDAGISPDGLHKPLAQVFFRVRHHHDAGPLGMLEHMVRTVHPVKHPAGLPHLAYQVGAGHLCMIHIYEYSGKAPTDEKGSSKRNAPDAGDRACKHSATASACSAVQCRGIAEEASQVPLEVFDHQPSAIKCMPFDSVAAALHIRSKVDIC